MTDAPSTKMIWGSSILSNFIVSLVFLLSRINNGMPENEAVARFFFAWPVGTIAGALLCIYLFKVLKL